MDNLTQAGTLSDENLPEASTTDPSRILNSNDYEIYENVPVFVEHTRVLKSGRELQFGRPELELLAARSNRRIEETGDFVPVVVGHTNSDPKGPEPPKIGWAGPFRVGWLTKDHNKYAILADFRIDKDKTELLNKYPRRSAELWAEERYEDMYIDPISLLGADTPWSDMGVLYNKDGDPSREKIFYSIQPQAPGAYGTGMPKPVCSSLKGKCGDKEKYSMEEGEDGTGALSKDQKQVAQTIISAIFESPEFQFLRRQMSKKSDEDLDDDSPQRVEQQPDATPAPVVGSDDGLQDDQTELSEEPFTPPTDLLDDNPTDVADDSSAEEDEEFDSPIDSSEQYDAGNASSDESQGGGGVDQSFSGGGGTSATSMGAPEGANYFADGDAQDADEVDYSADGDVGDAGGGDDVGGGGEVDYAADSDSEDEDDDDVFSLNDEGDDANDVETDYTDTENDGVNENDVGVNSDDDSEDDEDDLDFDFPSEGLNGLGNGEDSDDDVDDEEEDEDYYPDDEMDDSEESPVGNDSDKGDDNMTLKDKVAELEYKVMRLQKAFDYTTNKVVSRERYSKLQDLRRQYVFDEKSEREKCRYSKMTDAQFAARCREIASNYRPVPTNIRVPSWLVESAPAGGERPGAVQYSKERAADIESRVAQLADSYASRGVYKSSEEIRNEVAKSMGLNR